MTRKDGVIETGIKIPEGNPDDFPLENLVSMIEFEEKLIAGVHQNVINLEAKKKLWGKHPQYITAINETIKKEQSKLPDEERLLTYLRRELVEEQARRKRRNKPS